MDIVIHTPRTTRRKIWAMVRHDLVNILQHPYYLISLLVPVFMSLVFMLMSPALRDSDELIVVIYDPENTRLTAALQTLPTIIVRQVASETAVMEALTGDATGGLIIPADFDTAVVNDQVPPLQVFFNAQARGTHIATFRRLVNDQIWRLRYPNAPATIEWVPLNAEEDLLADFEMTNYLFITLAILTITIINLTLIPQMMIEERDQKALVALLASPVNFAEILISKAVAGFVYSVIILGILTLLNQGWVGRWPLTAVMLLLATLLSIGGGLALGMALKSKSQCNGISSILILLLNLPTWFSVVPLSALPLMAGVVLRMIPTYYVINTLAQTLLDKVSPWEITINFLVVLACTILVYGLVVWQVRRRPFSFSAQTI